MVVDVSVTITTVVSGVATLVVGNVSTMAWQVELTPTVAVTVQVPPDVCPTLDEFVSGAVAGQFGCTTGFLRTHHLANESQLNHDIPTRGSERL